MSNPSKDYTGTNADLQADVLKATQENHISLNAFQCIKPTDEFLISVGRSVVQMAMDRANCLPSWHGESDAEPVSDLSKLTPTLYLHVNAS